MSTKDTLILENQKLREKLALAEQWMRREISSSTREITRDHIKKANRKHMQNLLEEDTLDIITREITEYFGTSLSSAPEHTLERLIDSEIYWYTLQKYPTMDGLPVILAYQKILDAWIEERLVKDFRKNKKIKTLVTKDALEKDISNILTKNYTLSIGRLYQILSSVRDRQALSPLVSDLVNFWEKENQTELETLTSDTFFIPFFELMDREIFTKKRHEKKVTFSDVKRVREMMVGGYKDTSSALLKILVT